MTDKVGSVKLSCKHDIPIDTKTYNNTDPNAFVSLRVAFNPVFLHFSDLARTEHEVDTFDDYTKHITLCLDCYKRLATVLPDTEWRNTWPSKN